ncbi:MAG: hypothetical protein JWQ72_931 [Polaromonas sp.]|nr:hypothetical protein [Polaromonas sp.]
MRFDIFQKRGDAHIQKVKQYLQEANLARIEHQVAAEHHAALASMYVDRVAWLEQELANADNHFAWAVRGAAPKQVDGPKHSKSPSVVSWLRAHSVDGNLPESA